MTSGDDAVLVGCAPAGPEPGGLFVYDEGRLETVDRVGCCGLAVGAASVWRGIPDPGGRRAWLAGYGEDGLRKLRRATELDSSSRFAPTLDDDDDVVASTRAGLSRLRTRSGTVTPVDSTAVPAGEVVGLASGPQGLLVALRTGPGRSGAVVRAADGAIVVDGIDDVGAIACAKRRWLLGSATALLEVASDGTVTELAELPAPARALSPLADGRIAVAVWSGSVADSGRLLVLGREGALEDDFELEAAAPSALVFCDKALLGGVLIGARANARRVMEAAQHRMFEAAGVSPVRLWATGEPLPPESHHVEIESDPPASLAPGERVRVPVRLVSHAPAILSPEPPYSVLIGVRWFTCEGAPALDLPAPTERLPGALVPGTELWHGLDLVAPGEPGEYEARISLVQEWCGWFDDFEPRSVVRVRIRVVSARDRGATG